MKLELLRPVEKYLEDPGYILRHGRRPQARHWHHGFHPGQPAHAERRRSLRRSARESTVGQVDSGVSAVGGGSNEEGG